MTVEQAQIGVWVKSMRDFAGVPTGTKGLIDEDYGTGITVAWDLPEGIINRSPVFNVDDPKTWAIRTGIIRDGFDKKTELHFLEIV